MKIATEQETSSKIAVMSLICACLVALSHVAAQCDLMILLRFLPQERGQNPDAQLDQFQIAHHRTSKLAHMRNRSALASSARVLMYHSQFSRRLS